MVSFFCLFFISFPFFCSRVTWSHYSAVSSANLEVDSELTFFLLAIFRHTAKRATFFDLIKEWKHRRTIFLPTCIIWSNSTTDRMEIYLLLSTNWFDILLLSYFHHLFVFTSTCFPLRLASRTNIGKLLARPWHSKRTKWTFNEV